MFFIWPLSAATAGCLKQASEAQSSFGIFCECHADDSCQVSLCNCALHLGETCETGTLSAAVASSDSEAVRAGQHKIDNNYALAIAEAARRPGLHTVPVKTEQQKDQQALHKCQQSLIKRRIQLTNMWRSLLSESDEVLKHLMQIPGYGPVVSSAFVSALSDGRQFKCGRVATAWAGGLVPRHFGSGGGSGNQPRPSDHVSLRGQSVGKAGKCSVFVSYLCN